MNTDILHISQEDQDWQLADSHAEIQLGTFHLSFSGTANLPQEDFDNCKTNAQPDWENLLHNFDIIETGEADRTSLITAFTDSSSSTDFSEIDESGKAIHGSVTGTIKPGVLFSNNGFWDTLPPSPLFIIPERITAFFRRFLNSYRDTGFFQNGWSDEHGMMPGTL